MRQTTDYLNDENAGVCPRNTPRKTNKYILVIIFFFILIAIIIFAILAKGIPSTENTYPALSSPGQSALTSSTPLIEKPSVSVSIVPSVIPELSETPLTQAIDSGMWGDRFSEQFAAGETVITKNSYQSKDIFISINRVHTDGVAYFVADVYIRNLDNFRTAFAGGSYRKGTSRTLDMASENAAVLAISGDYYRAREVGIVIRNGELFRDAIFKDVLIMYNDGSMQTFSPKSFDIDEAIQNGAYQGWSFGPILLTDGLPMETFNSDVSRANPRCAIGYYKPGHYCFVLVDGRQPGYSHGMTLKELSQLFYDLGCKEAYNLDGGQTAIMVFMGEIVNKPANGGRRSSDIVYIAENDE
ncbi:MAG: phosphodiester glycosidase family protein [Christensenellales bacterium]|jgi:exopolysaccharide biosynthesis protein